VNLNDAARQLATVLRAENDCLRAGNTPGATALLARKQAATQALQAALPGNEADPHWAGLLRDLAAENRTLLTQAMEVQSRILEMVARAARAAVPGPMRYGKTGAARSSIGAMAMALRA
jgi:flagellar biosynthesis/type III secretory pathway chaperone